MEGLFLLATPYGHALLGLSLLLIWMPNPRPQALKGWTRVGLFLLLAEAPDLDFLPGIIAGSPGRFHQGEFHSLGFALGLALGVGWAANWLRGYAFWPCGGVAFLLVFSHLALDFFTQDLRPPFGFPIFWPLTAERFLSPIPIFPHVIRQFPHPEFWSRNLWAAGVETWILLPGLIAAFLVQRLAKNT
jgi:inner membrane protein